MGFQGATHASTLTIRDDGTWTNEIPNLPPGSFSGRVQMEQGQLRFRSDTTGRVGTMLLHEERGERVLMMKGDDGLATDYKAAR